jgi:hypothetical protein
MQVGFTPNPLWPSPPRRMNWKVSRQPYDADAAGKAGVARLAYAAEASRNTNCGKPGALRYIRGPLPYCMF